jgi:hypothetical protein
VRCHHILTTIAYTIDPHNRRVNNHEKNPKYTSLNVYGCILAVSQILQNSSTPHIGTQTSSNMTSIASGDKINFDFDIKVMKDLLHTIHSEDLIHRQPSEAQRTAYANTVTNLEEKVVQAEGLLAKRRGCGRRMKRFLNCHDELYDQVVLLKSALNSVYSDLQNNAM